MIPQNACYHQNNNHHLKSGILPKKPVQQEQLGDRGLRKLLFPKFPWHSFLSENHRANQSSWNCGFFLASSENNIAEALHLI